MKKRMIFFVLFSFIFTASTVSLLKENKNILRPSISRIFDLNSESIDILNDGWRSAQLDYIFNGNYRVFGAYGIDDKSSMISFYYYKIFNDFFINTGLNIEKYSEYEKLYNYGFVGAGLSKSISKGVDLSSQFFYWKVINSDDDANFSGLVYADVKYPSTDFGLQFGISKNFINSDHWLYLSLSYHYKIN